MVELDYEMLKLGPGGASLLAGWKLRLQTTTRLVRNRMDTKLESEAYTVFRFIRLLMQKSVRTCRTGAFQVQIWTDERIRGLDSVVWHRRLEVLAYENHSDRRIIVQPGGIRGQKICADAEFFARTARKYVAASDVGR